VDEALFLKISPLSHRPLLFSCPHKPTSPFLFFFLVVFFWSFSFFFPSSLSCALRFLAVTRKGFGECVFWNFRLEEERVLGGTLNVKFGIYMHEMTIFRGGY